MKKVCMLAVCVVAMALMVTGCGSGVSDNKPVAEVKTEAKTMDATQLKSIVEKYQQAIAAKQPQIEKLKTQLKAIPISQLMGDDAKAIQTEIAKITESVKALTDRMRVYAAELRVKQ